MTTNGGATLEEAHIGYDGHDMFVDYAGQRIAVRGHPGTPQAKKWIPLFLGVDVVDVGDGEIAISFSNLSPNGLLS